MVRQDGAEARKERISNIAQTIQARLTKLKMNKEPEWLPLGKTIAELMLSTGLTKNKLKEYLELLQAAGQFELDYEKDRIQRPQT